MYSNGGSLLQDMCLGLQQLTHQHTTQGTSALGTVFEESAARAAAYHRLVVLMGEAVAARVMAAAEQERAQKSAWELLQYQGMCTHVPLGIKVR